MNSFFINTRDTAYRLHPDSDEFLTSWITMLPCAFIEPEWKEKSETCFDEKERKRNQRRMRFGRKVLESKQAIEEF